MDTRLAQTTAYEYDENGYLISRDGMDMWNPDNVYPRKTIYEYNEETGAWRADYIVGSEIRFSDENLVHHPIGYWGGDVSINNVYISPFAYTNNGVFGAATVENQYVEDYTSVYGEENWAYAEFKYNGDGNAVRSECYSKSGELTGYCEFEWALLTLGADGKYTGIAPDREPITVTARIIHNVDVYQNELSAYREQYDGSSFGIMQYGIIFEPPVNSAYFQEQISEAILKYPKANTGDSLKENGFAVLYDGDGAEAWWGWNEEHYNKLYEITGYLSYGENNGARIVEYSDDTHPDYLFYPNGAYMFEIVDISLI